jgi:hypothetical protein
VSVAEAVDPVEGYDWELYNVKEDFSQAVDLAKTNPVVAGPLPNTAGGCIHRET